LEIAVRANKLYEPHLIPDSLSGIPSASIAAMHTYEKESFLNQEFSSTRGLSVYYPDKNGYG
jgi:hypothetical protein